MRAGARGSSAANQTTQKENGMIRRTSLVRTVCGVALLAALAGAVIAGDRAESLMRQIDARDRKGVTRTLRHLGPTGRQKLLREYDPMNRMEGSFRCHRLRVDLIDAFGDDGLDVWLNEVLRGKDVTRTFKDGEAETFEGLKNARGWDLQMLEFHGWLAPYWTAGCQKPLRDGPKAALERFLTTRGDMASTEDYRQIDTVRRNVFWDDYEAIDRERRKELGTPSPNLGAILSSAKVFE
jgi:hypothetical protein